MQRCPVEVILARCAVLRLDLASLGQRSNRARGLSLSTSFYSSGVALSTVQWDVLKNPKRLSHNESRYLTCRFRKSCAPVLPLSAVSVVASALRATAGAAPCSRRCRRSFPHKRPFSGTKGAPLFVLPGQGNAHHKGDAPLPPKMTHMCWHFF